MSCKPCCKRTSKCNKCASCLPQTLCVSGTVSPAGGTGTPQTGTATSTATGTGSGAPLCCVEYANRIPSDAMNCGWSGVVGCSVAMFDLFVEVVERGKTGTGTSTFSDTGTGSNNSPCETRVTSQALNHTWIFHGSLPVMHMTGTDTRGYEYSFTVQHPAVVTNPYYVGACAPCKCAGCLPAKICASVTIYGGETPTHDGMLLFCGGTGSLVCPWNCNGWTGGDIQAGDKTYNVSISMGGNVETGTASGSFTGTGTGSGSGTQLTNECAITVHVSGPHINQFKTIFLEDTGDFKTGISCKEQGSTGVLNRNGGGHVYTTDTIFNTSFALFSTETGAQLGLFSLNDLACSDKCEKTFSKDCSGSCPKFQPCDENCCGKKPWHIELISPCPQLDGKNWVVATEVVCGDFQGGNWGDNTCQRRSRPDLSSLAWACGSDACPDGGISQQCSLFWYEGNTDCGDKDVDMSRYRCFLQMGGAFCSGPPGCSQIFPGQRGAYFHPYLPTTSCTLGRIDFQIPTSFFISPGNVCQCCHDKLDTMTILRVSL